MSVKPAGRLSLGKFVTFENRTRSPVMFGDDSSEVAGILREVVSARPARATARSEKRKRVVEDEEEVHVNKQKTAAEKKMLKHYTGKQRTKPHLIPFVRGGTGSAGIKNYFSVPTANWLPDLKNNAIIQSKHLDEAFQVGCAVSFAWLPERQTIVMDTLPSFQDAINRGLAALFSSGSRVPEMSGLSPEQLPPYDTTLHAKVENDKFYLSLGEHVFKKSKEDVKNFGNIITLVESYRFPEKMMDLVNDLAMRTLPAVCIDVVEQTYTDSRRSKVVPEEHWIVVHYGVGLLISCLVNGHDVPSVYIVSPYTGAVAYMLKVLRLISRALQMDVKTRDLFHQVRSKFKIQTIFTSAGEECDIVVICSSRSSIGR